MMLNSDLCLVFKNKGQGGGGPRGGGGTTASMTLNAKNGECCTWIKKGDVQNAFPAFGNNEPYCGKTLGTV